MATLYVTFKPDCEAPTADAHEKVTIGASDATTTAAALAKFGVIELATDTVCLAAINAAGNTTKGAFYVYPGIKYTLKVGAGVKVTCKAA